MEDIFLFFFFKLGHENHDINDKDYVCELQFTMSVSCNLPSNKYDVFLVSYEQYLLCIVSIDVASTNIINKLVC